LFGRKRVHKLFFLAVGTTALGARISVTKDAAFSRWRALVDIVSETGETTGADVAAAAIVVASLRCDAIETGGDGSNLVSGRSSFENHGRLGADD